MNRDKGETEKMDCRPVFVEKMGTFAGRVYRSFSLVNGIPYHGYPSPWGKPVDFSRGWPWLAFCRLTLAPARTTGEDGHMGSLSPTDNNEQQRKIWPDQQPTITNRKEQQNDFSDISLGFFPSDLCGGVDMGRLEIPAADLSDFLQQTGRTSCSRSTGGSAAEKMKNFKRAIIFPMKSTIAPFFLSKFVTCNIGF